MQSKQEITKNKNTTKEVILSMITDKTPVPGATLFINW